MTRAVVPVALLLLLLVACDPYALQRREAVDAGFVGRSETELVRLLGVPTRTVTVGDHRFLAYDERQTQIQPPFYPGFDPAFGYGWGFGGGFGPPLPAEVVQYLCETTFEVASGRVIGFSLRGNSCG